MNVTKAMIDDIQQHSNSSTLISLGADGAIVMSGEIGGVAELLRMKALSLACVRTLHHTSSQFGS